MLRTTSFYVEHWFHTLFWAKVRQVGQILSNAGFFGSADDVWFLKRDEDQAGSLGSDYGLGNWREATRPLLLA